MDDMVADIIERLNFLRAQPTRALVIGDWTGELADHLMTRGSTVERADLLPNPHPRDPGQTGAGEQPIDEERPFVGGGFDLVVSLGLLDTVNDLPGALVHLHRALSPGGRAIASFMGAGSLPAMRAAMRVADGERQAARIHPMVDVRAGAELIQRAGWADPVVDGHALRVRYRSFAQELADLRAQGMSNVLATRAPVLNRDALRRAAQAFAERADEDGRIVETFEIITLSGRRGG